MKEESRDRKYKEKEIHKKKKHHKHKKDKKHKKHKHEKNQETHIHVSVASAASNKQSPTFPHLQSSSSKHNHTLLQNSSKSNSQHHNIGSGCPHEKVPDTKNALKSQPETNAAEKKKIPMIPQCFEDYQKQQSQISQIYDEESGRYRLIRGTGEIIESIVSKSQHRAINQHSTYFDGQGFQKRIHQSASARR
eukprot:Sdes_comp23795_c0_seq1m21951